MITVGKYILSDERKYRRCYDNANGGFGPDATEADILAYYDKMGGCIKNLKGEVMPVGTFWDFAGKVAKTEKKEVKVVKKAVKKVAKKATKKKK